MDLENLLLSGILLATLPLAGAMMAMMHGVIIWLTRHGVAPPQSAAQARGLDRLESALRSGAAFFGLSVQDARRLPDRRQRERRVYLHRHRHKPPVDRRRHERRERNRRLATRLHHTR